MLTVYGLNDGGSAACPTEGGVLRWIELLAPDQEDIARAASLAGVDVKLIHDALDLHERPRIEVDDEATLLVIRAPHQEHGNDQPSSQDRHSTVPLGVVLTRESIVAVCKLRDTPLVSLLADSRGKPEAFRPERAICHLNRGVALLFLNYLKGISATIRELERDLSHSLDNDDLMLLLNLQKSVTYFHAALKTNDILLDRVIRKGLTVGVHGRLVFNAEEEDILDDAQTDLRQGIYMSKIFTEVLNSVAGVYSSIISNNVNQIMKILTSLTVILMIPTLITSTYGMNINLPLQGHGSAFAVVATLSVGFTSAAIWFMKRKKIL